MTRRRISHTDILVKSLLKVPCAVTAVYGERGALYPGRWTKVETLMATSARNFQGLHRVADAGRWVQYESPLTMHKLLLSILGAKQPVEA